MGRGAYIRDVNWVTYLGEAYIRGWGGSLYTGSSILHGFYGIGIFKMKLTWSKSSRLLQRVAFLVYLNLREPLCIRY